MRIRDDKKQEALLLATVKVVNEIGFAASSVSKIAKEAGVSPATLYVYFKNKEDLLISTYVEIKKGMGNAMLEGFDDTRPVHDILHQVWRNSFQYVVENKNEFRYAEQFSNSPFVEQVDKDRIQKSFEPLFAVVQRGIEQKILKEVNLELVATFLFHPILVLANPNHCSTFELSQANIDLAFRMTWDAIRL